MVGDQQLSDERVSAEKRRATGFVLAAVGFTLLTLFEPSTTSAWVVCSLRGLKLG